MDDHNTGYTQPIEPQKCIQQLPHDHLHENFELPSLSLKSPLMRYNNAFEYLLPPQLQETIKHTEDEEDVTPHQQINNNNDNSDIK